MTAFSRVRFSVQQSQSRRVLKRVTPRTESSLTKLRQPVVGDVGIQTKRPTLLRPRPPTRPAQRMYVTDRLSTGFRRPTSHSKHTKLTEQRVYQPQTLGTQSLQSKESANQTLEAYRDCESTTLSTELTEQRVYQPQTLEAQSLQSKESANQTLEAYRAYRAKRLPTSHSKY